MKNQKKATTFALLAIMFWSTVGTAFKLSLQYVDFLHLLLFASLISVIVIAAIITFSGNWQLIRNTNRSGLVHSALLGFLNPFLYYAILLKAYSILPAQEAIVLNYTWPIVLLLLSIPLLKQKVSKRSIFAILISFFGTIVTVTHGNPGGLNFAHPLGTTLAMGSAFIWASFWIFNARDQRDELNKLFFNFLFGFLYTLLAVSVKAFLNSDLKEVELIGQIIPLISLNGIAGIAYIGLFEMGITFVLWMKAMQLTNSTARITNLIYISPFVSLMLVGLILGEAILPSTMAGLILIVSGIFLQGPLKKQ